MAHSAEGTTFIMGADLFIQEIIDDLLNEKRKVALVEMNIRSRNAMMLDVWMNVLMMRRG
jgi:hypothetical protein